ncbi:hypothetical protein G195_001982 [Phytophthora kernoviae 00238/432]|uniref:VOC domain-containing protein n=1 Tax=Phytophthora kernoviae 00238/432 TaxID=1284355 RepID=A0A8J4SF72_9STRA|nr:hypothetical protein G195_001982 [Phytophthora kernoviae 00238/432]
MLLPPWGWMFVIAPAAGFGFGMIEAVIGTIIIAAIKDNTAVAMSRLEVLFGIGAMVMPLIASGLISAGYWRMSFLVVAVCAAMTFIFWAKSSFGELDSELSRRSSGQTSGHAPAAESPDGTNSPGIKPTRSTYQGRNLALLSLFVLFFFLYVGTEMSLANFMPAILIEKMNMKEAGAALSVTCFWIAMSIGRLFAGYIAERFQYRVYVLYSCLAAVVLLMIFPFTNQIWSAFLIILLLGLALSGVFSIALVFASKMLPGTEESTPSILIASGGVGGAILPLVTGWSLDHLEVNHHFLRYRRILDMSFQKRIDHVGIAVRDLETTLRFYTEIVGLELKDRVTHTNGVIQLAFLGFNGSDETEIELIQGYSDKLPSEGTVHHFAIHVDDLESEYNRIKETEAEFIDGEIITLPNGYRYFFIYGPEKEWIEFFQR